MRDRIDLAVRVGQAGESTLVVRKLAAAPIVLCGAPSYFERQGRPRTPQELEHHTWLHHAGLDDIVRSFRRGRETVQVTLSGRFSSNDGAATVEAAVEGAGMLVVPEFEVAEEIRKGLLERVLPDWVGRPLDTYIVLPSRCHVPTRVRTVERFLRKHLSPAPWAL